MSIWKKMFAATAITIIACLITWWATRLLPFWALYSLAGMLLPLVTGYASRFKAIRRYSFDLDSIESELFWIVICPQLVIAMLIHIRKYGEVDLGFRTFDFPVYTPMGLLVGVVFVAFVIFGLPRWILKLGTKIQI